MRKIIPCLISFALLTVTLSLEAQKTYKAVCDKSDGKVKIVESEDRSPDMLPLKGGFPFIQVAQNWVKENYPGGTCDPVAAARQNQAAADALTQAATPEQQPTVNTTTKQTAVPNSFFNSAAGDR